MTYGLGGINPNIKYNTIDLLRYLYLEGEKYLLDIDEFKKIAVTTIAMINQESIDITTNGNTQKYHFRHHFIYVSHHESTAVGYSVINEYGSEIITRLATIFLLLKGKIPDFKLPPELDKIGLEAIIGKKYIPILIKTKPLDHSYLAKEDGKTSEEALAMFEPLKRFGPEGAYNFLSRYANFELLKPVMPNELTIFEIKYMGNIRQPKTFKYTLMKLI